jgi:hypothetical protein
MRKLSLSIPHRTRPVGRRSHCFKRMLLIKRDELDVGVPMLTAAVDELRRARYVQYETPPTSSRRRRSSRHSPRSALHLPQRRQ